MPHCAVGQRLGLKSAIQIGFRHALFPAAGMARKVMVACANVRVLAVVGMPVMVGSSSPAERASVRPFRSDTFVQQARGVQRVTDQLRRKRERVRRIAVGIDHQKRHPA